MSLLEPENGNEFEDQRSGTCVTQSASMDLTPRSVQSSDQQEQRNCNEKQTTANTAPCTEATFIGGAQLKLFIEQLICNLNDEKRQKEALQEENIALKSQLEEVLKNNPKQHAPVTRAKSAPERPDVEVQRSKPEIFIFPEMNEMPKISGKLNSVNKTLSSIRSEADGAETYERNVELPNMKSAVPAVSQVYFFSAVDQLAKAKTQLHSMLIRQGIEKKEMAKLRQERKVLQSEKEHLEENLKESKSEIANLQEAVQLLESKPGKNDSFELESEQAAEVPVGKLAPAIQYYVNRTPDSQLEAVIKERDAVNSELQDLNREYNNLKDSVKILSTCLHEEKACNRKCEEQLKHSKSEKKTILEQLGKLRTQYEELRQEKAALEKEMSICGERYPSSESRASSSSAQGGRRVAQQSRYQHDHIPASTNSSFDMNILPPGTSLWNNLSGSERKVSNVGNERLYICPRCLQKFYAEATYQIHLNKCVE